MPRRSIALTLFAVVALVGCDNGPSLQVTPEPAGANCPTGGFLIEADGQTFYACNGAATTERIPEGAEGNPCFGPALRLTIPASDGTTRYAYVCEDVEVDPQLETVLFGQFDMNVAQARLECLCTDDPEAQAACEEQLELYQGLRRAGDTCVGEVLAAAGPPPAEAEEAIGCIADHIEAVRGCYDAIDANECSMDVEEAILVCEALESEGADCPEPPSSVQAWGQSLSAFAEFLDCPLILSGGS